jgi:hypothetical protein
MTESSQCLDERPFYIKVKIKQLQSVLMLPNFYKGSSLMKNSA